MRAYTPMMWKVWVGCGVLGSGACGGGNPSATVDDDGAVSGSRLKLRWYDMDDGPRTWVDSELYDSLLATTCAATVFADGKRYCQPTGPFAEIVYSDAACTQRAVASTSPAPPATAEDFQLPDPACGGGGTIAVYAVGAVIAATSYFVKNANGTCSQPVAIGTNTLYTAGAQITNLVELTIDRTTNGARLVQEAFTSADGLRLPIDTFFDSQTGIDCSPDPLSGLCLPFEQGGSGRYPDATCSNALASWNSACPAPTIDVQRTACSGAKLFAVGSPFTGPQFGFFSDTNPVCMPAEPIDGQSYAALGDQLEIVGFQRVHNAAMGRLGFVDETAEGVFARSSYFDLTVGTECSPSAATDGSVTCRPLSGELFDAFSDAQCSVPIVLGVVPTGGPDCMPQTRPVTTTMLVSGELVITRLGTVHTAPVFDRTMGPCAVDTFFTNGLELHDLGAVIPESALATGTLVTDE